MWLVQADQDIGPVPCFIRAEAEDPVCVRHEAARSRLAQTRGLGADSAHAHRRGTGTVPAPGPGGRDAIQGLPISMQARLAESKGKRPGLLLRTENHPAGNEIGFRCLLGARAPSQAQPPVQPVPRSGPAITSGAVTSGTLTSGAVTSGSEAAGCNAPARRGPDHHGPATLRPASPVLDCVQKLTAHPGDVNPGNCYFTYT